MSKTPSPQLLVKSTYREGIPDSTLLWVLQSTLTSTRFWTTSGLLDEDCTEECTDRSTTTDNHPPESKRRRSGEVSRLRRGLYHRPKRVFFVTFWVPSPLVRKKKKIRSEPSGCSVWHWRRHKTISVSSRVSVFSYLCSSTSSVPQYNPMTLSVRQSVESVRMMWDFNFL